MTWALICGAAWAIVAFIVFHRDGKAQALGTALAAFALGFVLTLGYAAFIGSPSTECEPAGSGIYGGC